MVCKSTKEYIVFSSLVLWWILDAEALSDMEGMGRCEDPSEDVMAGSYVASSETRVSVVLDSEGDTTPLIVNILLFFNRIFS